MIHFAQKPKRTKLQLEALALAAVAGAASVTMRRISDRNWNWELAAIEPAPSGNGLAQAGRAVQPLQFAFDLEDWASAALQREDGKALMHRHLYGLGEQVSYAEDGVAWPWKGGFEVIALLPAGIDEPAYRIRNPDQAYDRVVREHELSKDTDGLGRQW